MAGRATNITARVLFFLSGTISVLVALVYTMMRGSDLPNQREWIIFAAAFFFAGGISVLAAVFPASWTAKIFRIADRFSLFSFPLRMLGAFAVLSYLLTVGFLHAPHEWNLGGFFWTFLLCPVYIVRETFDPSGAEVFLALAPINAAVYGAVGTMVGFALVPRRRCNRAFSNPAGGRQHRS